MVKKKREAINPEPGTLNLLTQTVSQYVQFMATPIAKPSVFRIFMLACWAFILDALQIYEKKSQFQELISGVYLGWNIKD